MYRAFHAMPPLSNAGGEATGALYGFLNMLRKLLWEFDPDYLVVVFDAKGKNFRNDLFSGYKANRPRMPDELRDQMGPIKEIIAAMGISVLVVPGVEAEDVIGTLSTAAKIEALDVWIASGDKDLTQLVGGTVSMINTVDGKILDSDRDKEKFGVFIAKDETRSNWIKRPLRESQLKYAASDVEHLIDLFNFQKEELDLTGKIDWFNEEIVILLNKILFQEGRDDFKISKNFFPKKEEERLLKRFNEM